MAKLSVFESFVASHGTSVVADSTFRVELTVSGSLVGDFVGGHDDRKLRKLLQAEIAALEMQRLDDVVGRATLENIAAYFLYRFPPGLLESIEVAARASRVVVYESDVDRAEFPAELHFRRGLSLLLRGEGEQALAAFTHASELAPNCARILNARGRCLRRMGRLLEAIADFDRAIVIAPAFGEAYRNRGNVLLELGRHDAMLEDFDRAVKLMPDSAVAFNNRGFARQQRREFDAAIADHTRAVELDPGYEEAFRDRAAALSELKRLDEAAEDLARAVCLEGKRGDVEVERAKLTWDLTRRTEGT